MRILKVLLLVLVLALVTGCSCKAKRIGSNVPYATDGGPLADINFAFDSYSLDSNAKARLDANYEWLVENGRATIKVEGHCDERGTNEYNMALGAKRAQAALDYLIGKGLDSNRASTISYGEELPLDPASNEAAWAKNRRVHFDVTE